MKTIAGIFAVLLIVLFLIFPFVAFSATGTVGLQSNYLWRGTTFSDNKAVVQASGEASVGKGFYLGTFISNATMLDDSRDHMTHEVDAIIGKRFIKDDLIVDIYHNHYFFPNAGVYDTHETTAQIQYKKSLISFSQMDDFFGYGTIYRYVRAGQSFEYKPGLEGALLIGFNTFEKQKKAGNTDYFDVLFVNKKTLTDGSYFNAMINYTNRQLYSDSGKEQAKDLMFIVGYTIPFEI